jgi:uncharacterized protein YceK
MRKRELAATLVTAATLALGGCGTAANVLLLKPEEGGQSIYGGVQADLHSAKGYAAEVSDSSDIREQIDGASEALFVAALDLPLSAVADTLTLPWTLATRLGQPAMAPPPNGDTQAWRRIWEPGPRAAETASKPGELTTPGTDGAARN